jgi:hypothetical protein
VCFADCCRPIPATVHSLCISGSGGSPRLPHSLQSCQQRARSPRSTAVDSESQRHMRHVAIQGLKEGTGPRRERGSCSANKGQSRNTSCSLFRLIETCLLLLLWCMLRWRGCLSPSGSLGNQRSVYTNMPLQAAKVEAAMLFWTVLIASIILHSLSRQTLPRGMRSLASGFLASSQPLFCPTDALCIYTGVVCAEEWTGWRLQNRMCLSGSCR